MKAKKYSQKNENETVWKANESENGEKYQKIIWKLKKKTRNERKHEVNASNEK